MIRLKQALLDPSSVFQEPKDVLLNNEISRDQKIQILKRWESEVREIQVAEEENMQGKEPVDLHAILSALHTLDAIVDVEHNAPTKQSDSLSLTADTIPISGIDPKKTIKIHIIFYSMYGHTYQMAQAVKRGVEQIANVEVTLYRVAELVPEDVLEKSGAKKAQAQFEHIAIAKPEYLLEADAIIFGTPTRFGNMCAQMRNFLDQTGSLWVKDQLVGKVGSVFVGTGTQHGGQETTITSFHSTLLHLGMIIAGVPYNEKRLLTMTEITGGSPYGAGTLAGAQNDRQPSDNELAIATFQGQYVAQITRDLIRGRRIDAD